MTSQNIVITMAGRGSRFTEAGYKEPKYQIYAHNFSLFIWSMSSLKNIIGLEDKIIFVCLKENNAKNFIFAECQKLLLNNIYIFELDEITDGQATSAFLSNHLWDLNKPLLIYNIDTFVNPFLISTTNIKKGSDGWIPCFQAKGDHWSFVEVNNSGWATNVSEKKRISELASIGLYWFKLSSDFIKTYKNSLLIKNTERFIAPLYNSLIQSNKKISIINLPCDHVFPLGTPLELNAFLSKNISMPK